MASGLFALIYVAAAWSAWRKNPMYSARLTLRLVALITLGVGALFAAAIAATDYAERTSSPLAGAVAIASVCLFGCLALIWLMLQLTIPKTPPLSAGVRLVRVNRAKLLPWVRRFGWAVLALGLLAVALPARAAIAGWTIGAIFLVIGIVALFTVYILALNLDRSLTSVEDDPWMHWRYTPEEWKAWSDVEVARIEAATEQSQWHREWKVLVVTLIVVTIPFVVGASPDDWRVLAAFAAGSWLLILSLVVITDRYGKTAPYRMRRLLANTAPETYFGDGGLFADGVYSQWQTMANYLREVALDERAPRSLAFVFVKAVSGGTVEVHQSVLIPAGATNDLPRLQTALTAACPKAQVAVA